MCFHVWSKFRKIRLDDDIRNQDLHLGAFKTGFSNPKFKWYALYALGIPMIVSGATLIIHLLPENITKDIFLPFTSIAKEQNNHESKYNESDHMTENKLRCFFNNNLSTLLH